MRASRLLSILLTLRARSCVTAGELAEEGYRTITLAVGSIRRACSELLRLGPEAELPARPEPRAAMMDIGQLYQPR